MGARRGNSAGSLLLRGSNGKPRATTVDGTRELNCRCERAMDEFESHRPLVSWSLGRWGMSDKYDEMIRDALKKAQAKYGFGGADECFAIVKAVIETES